MHAHLYNSIPVLLFVLHHTRWFDLPSKLPLVRCSDWKLCELRIVALDSHFCIFSRVAWATQKLYNVLVLIRTCDISPTFWFAFWKNLAPCNRVVCVVQVAKFFNVQYCMTSGYIQQRVVLHPNKYSSKLEYVVTTVGVPCTVLYFSFLSNTSVKCKCWTVFWVWVMYSST